MHTTTLRTENNAKDEAVGVLKNAMLKMCEIVGVKVMDLAGLEFRQGFVCRWRPPPLP